MSGQSTAGRLRLCSPDANSAALANAFPLRSTASRGSTRRQLPACPDPAPVIRLRTPPCLCAPPAPPCSNLAAARGLAARPAGARGLMDSGCRPASYSWSPCAHQWSPGEQAALGAETPAVGGDRSDIGTHRGPGQRSSAAPSSAGEALGGGVDVGVGGEGSHDGRAPGEQLPSGVALPRSFSLLATRCAVWLSVQECPYDAAYGEDALCPLRFAREAHAASGAHAPAGGSPRSVRCV